MLNHSKEVFDEIDGIIEEALDHCFVRAGENADLEKAVGLLRAGIEKYPDDGRLNLRLFQVLNQQGKCDEGVEHLEHTVKKFPDDLDLQDLLLTSYTASQDKRYLERARGLAQKLSKLPLNVHQRRHVNYHMQKIEKQQVSSEEDHPDVKEIFTKAIRASYPYEDGGKEKLNKAAEILREGLKRFPDSYTLNQQLFFTLNQQGKADEGVEAYERYAARHPDDVRIQVSLLGKYVVLKDPKHYVKARKLVKDLAGKVVTVDDRGHYGPYAKFMKEADGALILDEAMRLSFPRDKDKVDFAKAEAVIREGIEAYPDCCDLYEHLYFVMRADGRGAEGIAELEKFAEEYPDDFDPQELLLNFYVGAGCYQDKARALLEELATWQVDENDRRHLLVHADCMGYDGDCFDGESHVEIEPE